jgi:hypothetical protein
LLARAVEFFHIVDRVGAYTLGSEHDCKAGFTLSHRATRPTYHFVYSLVQRTLLQPFERARERGIRIDTGAEA